MLSFATPLWLLGLGLVPVIRWLHRRGPNLRSVSVSSVALWRRAAVLSPAGGEHRPPDPAWRRRALLAVLLVLALAGPQMRERHTRITVWVDDSLSMLTREARGNRLAEGLAQVRAALTEAGPAEVDVRPLANPWAHFAGLGDSTVAAILAAAGRTEPAAPPAALLRNDSLHWLVTDGADAGVLHWPDERRPDRTFRVGAVTRNVGVERLSARRNLNDPDRYDLLLKLTNGGSAAETRSVVFATDSGDFPGSNERLEPGGSALVKATIPAATKVRALLQPGDALTEDDELVLDLAPLRRRAVAIDPTCPPALLAAVRAHPALAAAQSNRIDAVLDCGARGKTRNAATVRAVIQHAPSPPRGPLQWSSSVAASHRIPLDARFLQVTAKLDAQPGDTVLLAAGDEPLIVSRAGSPRSIETAVDFGAVRAASARPPEIPLVVDFLFAQVFGADLLDEIAIVDRGPNAVIVAPKHGVGADSPRTAPSEPPGRDIARAFLIAALVVFLWEILALARELRRVRHSGIRTAP